MTSLRSTPAHSIRPRVHPELLVITAVLWVVSGIALSMYQLRWIAENAFLILLPALLLIAFIPAVRRGRSGRPSRASLILEAGIAIVIFAVAIAAGITAYGWLTTVAFAIASGVLLVEIVVFTRTRQNRR